MGMRNTQEKVVAILSRVAEDNGLELLDDRKFGNTGTLRVETRTSVQPLLTIRYSFQDNYANFTIKPAHGLGRRGDGEMPYVPPEELQSRLVAPLAEVINRLGSETAKVDTGVKQARERRATGIEPARS